MENVIAVCIGVGLSAASGFRLFVPLLGLSIAARTGVIELSPGTQWLGTWPALLAFAVALIVEIAAYFIPWVDNLLDTIASPAAVIAGTLVTASLLGDMPPFYRWTLALIAGGGAAGIVKGGTAAVRGTSSLTTGGTANPLVSAAETVISVITTVLSLIVPVVAFVIVVLLCIFIVRRFGRLVWRRKATAPNG